MLQFLLPSKALENETAEGGDEINMSEYQWSWKMPEAFVWNAIKSTSLSQFK
jgi:hypothetical protein